jgi:hypothetical protein
MLATLPKNVDEQMLVTLPKMLMRKNVGKLLKNVEKNVGNISEKC